MSKLRIQILSAGTVLYCTKLGPPLPHTSVKTNLHPPPQALVVGPATAAVTPCNVDRERATVIGFRVNKQTD